MEIWNKNKFVKLNRRRNDNLIRVGHFAKPRNENYVFPFEMFCEKAVYYFSRIDASAMHLQNACPLGT